MKVVIAGQGKSGTTALFYKLLEAFPGDPETQVEVEHFRPSDAEDILAKVLIDPPGRTDFSSFQAFDKKVLIIRDPRDNLVSRLLYRAYNNKQFVSDPDAVASYLALLRLKEENTSNVSLRELIRHFDEQAGIDSFDRLQGHPVTGLDFDRRHPDYHRVRYEDMVDGRLENLSAYLGFTLSAETTEVGIERKRVERSKGYGQWRSWFTAEDIEIFRGAFQQYIEHYRYTTDWSLDTKGQLDPATSSGYVLRIVNERRSVLGLQPLRC